MSVAADIKQALAFTGYPCMQNYYTGTEPIYMVFNMSARPSAFSDDQPESDVWSVQLHLFAPFSTNTTTICRKIRNALRDAGFTYPDQINASSDARMDDGTEQHIVFEFDALEAIT